jgi:hypothetical protein
MFRPKTDVVKRGEAAAPVLCGNLATLVRDRKTHLALAAERFTFISWSGERV